MNKVTAFDFYTGAGRMSADDTLLHMRGIDFAHPVNVVDVPYGTTAQQLGRPGGMGSYFSSMGETAIRTGVEPAGRVPLLFQSMGPTKALQSTASNFVWPVGPTPGAGGAVRFFGPCPIVYRGLSKKTWTFEEGHAYRRRWTSTIEPKRNTGWKYCRSLHINRGREIHRLE